MKSRLRDILTDAIAREQDMELMGAGVVPDAVVCEVDDPLDGALADRLLRTLPHGRALMVARSGDRAALYELQPARLTMVDVSIDQLIEALRTRLEEPKEA